MSTSNFFIFSLYQPIGYLSSSSQRLDDTTISELKSSQGRFPTTTSQRHLVLAGLIRWTPNSEQQQSGIHLASLPASRHAPRASQQRAAVATSAIKRDEMTTLQREASTSEPSKRRDDNASTRSSFISHQKRRDDNKSRREATRIASASEEKR